MGTLSLFKALPLRSIWRSVLQASTNFYVLRCHPWPCMSLKLRFVMDSIPSALTISFQ
jgi:hypothetical protein